MPLVAPIAAAASLPANMAVASYLDAFWGGLSGGTGGTRGLGNFVIAASPEREGNWFVKNRLSEPNASHLAVKLA